MTAAIARFRCWKGTFLTSLHVRCITTSLYPSDRNQFVNSSYQTAQLHLYALKQRSEKKVPLEKCIDLMRIPTLITAEICM